MNNGKHTKVGPIRRGFEYQDVQAILLFLRWLENPELYEG